MMLLYSACYIDLMNIKLEAKPQALRSARIYCLQRSAMCSLTYHTSFASSQISSQLIINFVVYLHDWEVEYQTTNCTTLKWLYAVEKKTMCKVSIAGEGAIKLWLTLVIIPKDPFNQPWVFMRRFFAAVRGVYSSAFSGDQRRPWNSRSGRHVMRCSGR